MTHYSDDDLVLHYYRDADAPPHIAAHLVACGGCRERYDDLAESLCPLRTIAY